MDDHTLEIDPQFTGFTEAETPTKFSNNDFLSDNFDLSSLIDQSLAPLSVNNILTTMNHNLIQQQEEFLPPQPIPQYQPQQQMNLTSLNQLNMYQLLSAGANQLNLNGMPVIIVNLPQQPQHAVVSPATPSAEVSQNMAQMSMKEPIAGPTMKRIITDEPPLKKRRPSVVDESASDLELMALSAQMDMLRRNSLPVLHNIHVPRQRGIQPSISVDELISPSKFIPREDIDLLGEYGHHNVDEGEVVLLGEDEDEAEALPDSPPHNSNPFDYGNFFTSAPPAKSEFAATLQPLQIPTSAHGSVNHVHSAPTPTTEAPRKQRRRKSSTPGGDTPGNTPGTPATVDGRKLVCLGKRPRKNKKTQPEDQFLMKFTMRRNK